VGVRVGAVHRPQCGDFVAQSSLANLALSASLYQIISYVFQLKDKVLKIEAPESGSHPTTEIVVI